MLTDVQICNRLLFVSHAGTHIHTRISSNVYSAPVSHTHVRAHTHARPPARTHTTNTHARTHAHHKHTHTNQPPFFFSFLNKNTLGCQQPLLPLKPSIPSVKLSIHTQTLPDQAHYKQFTFTASVPSVKLSIHTQTLQDQTHCKQFTFYCKHPYRKP